MYKCPRTLAGELGEWCSLLSVRWALQVIARVEAFPVNIELIEELVEVLARKH